MPTYLLAINPIEHREGVDLLHSNFNNYNFLIHKIKFRGAIIKYRENKIYLYKYKNFNIHRYSHIMCILS